MELALTLTAILAPLMAWAVIALAGWAWAAQPEAEAGTDLVGLAGTVAVGAAALSALASLGLLLLAAVQGARWQAGLVWTSFGERSVELSLRLDPLSATMTALVSLIALAVTVYSLGYMREEKRSARYFAYLCFFIGAMQALAFSGSLLLLYIAWELVGLASYLLIGFYWERPEAGRAASKAFLVTRIGDTGLLLGIITLFLQTGTFDIQRNLAAVTSGQLSNR